MTNGHCIFFWDEDSNKKPHPIWADKVVVKPARNYNVNPYPNAVRTIVHNMTSSDGWITDGNYDYDYGFLSVDDGDADLNMGKMGYTKVMPGLSQTVTLAGYPDEVGDKANGTAGNRYMYVASGKVAEYRTRVISHKIDASEGDSGGPLYYQDSNGLYKAIGIHSNEYTDKKNKIYENRAVRITDSIFKAMAEYE